MAGGDEVVEGLEGLEAGYVALILEEAVDGAFGGEREVDDCVWDRVEDAAEFRADACVCWGRESSKKMGRRSDFSLPRGVASRVRGLGRR